ncbi:MAG TPA: ribosome biogenesis GTPase Der [Terriglobales bacterium]|nr:ribosome biogenesis GTPase Der [Terriglobales bacterium]
MAKKKKSANLPTLAIVGRPNVGKSTLFNRLVGSRRSIVGDEPGITRDRIYGETIWNGRELRIVDTGGILPDDKELIPTEIFSQAKVALEEADAIILVVDGRSAATSTDMELARRLLRGGKPLFLAVNKMDSPKLYAEAEEFRRLGVKNMFPISAEHSTNVAELLEAAMVAMPKTSAETEAELQEPEMEVEPEPDEPTSETESEGDGKRRKHYDRIPEETKVAIIGRPNVGKSTLLNRLTGSTRAIVSPIAGTTRDAVDELVIRDGQKYRFIDTAGIRRKGKTKLMAEKLSVVMARQHLESADVALLVIDAVDGVTAADATIGGYAHESGRSIIIVINKWDLVSASADRDSDRPTADRDIYEQQIRSALKFLSYAPIMFISASSGKNADKIFAKVQEVSKERRKRITTGQMNRFLKTVDFERATVPSRKKVKIFYMTQTNVAPPTFVLFTDKDVDLHFSFQRFLENQIREAFGFEGSPIWIKNRPRTKVELSEKKDKR